VHVDSYGTAPALSGKSDAELVEIVRANFDLRCVLFKIFKIQNLR
jgi:S-adenosylmethionine synthetase